MNTPSRLSARSASTTGTHSASRRPTSPCWERWNCLIWHSAGWVRRALLLLRRVHEAQRSVRLTSGRCWRTPDFQTDNDTQVSDKLKKLRKKIKKAETPEWDRHRADSDARDVPGGARPCATAPAPTTRTCPRSTAQGLYDSKTQHPEETEEDGISKSLKQVYASLWNYRAFIQRDFHRIDHMADRDGSAGASQLLRRAGQRRGREQWTLPMALRGLTTSTLSSARTSSPTRRRTRTPEEDTAELRRHVQRCRALQQGRRSGKLLMTDDQLAQLRQPPRHDSRRSSRSCTKSRRVNEFAIEIEFKITSRQHPVHQAGPAHGSSPPLRPEIHGVRLLGALAGSVLTASIRKRTHGNA